MAIFYRKTNITNDGYFDQRYPDLSDGQNKSVFVSGGVRDRIGFWNTKVSTKPHYGDALLVGTRLWLYAEALNEVTASYGDTGDVATNADFMLWKAKTSQSTNVTEGSTTPNCQDILTFSSYIGDMETQDFDALDGTAFYSGSASRVAKSISADYKIVLEGERITVEDLYKNQRGWVGTKLTRNAIMARYYVPPQESIFNISGGSGIPSMSDVTLNQDYIKGKLLDVARGSGTGNTLGLLAASGFIPGGALVVGATSYAIDQAERYNSQKQTDMTSAQAKKLYIYMEKMPGYEANVSAVTSGATGKSEEITTYISEGSHYWQGKVGDWGAAASRAVSGEGDGVAGMTVAAADIAQATQTKIVKKRWKPKNGTGTFTDDIWVYDEEVDMKYEKSETVQSVSVDRPDFTGLQLPPEDTHITTAESIFTQIRKTKTFEATITNAEDALASNPSGKVPISMSNFAFVDKSSEGATGNKMAMMECLHAFYEQDGTPARHLKSPRGNVDYLQEVRAQMYCPAPLNIDGSDNNDQWPYIQFTGTLELPGAPFAHEANYITMRRALFLGFNRYPIGKDNDILKVVDVAGASSSANTSEGCNGFFIHEWPTLLDNEYYAVSWIGDLDHTNAGDPRLKISGGSEKFPKAWIAKEDLANNECVFRFYATVDGIKMTIVNGGQSILRSADASDGSLANTAYEEGRLPYISLSGHEQDDGSSKYDNIGEWSLFRKYHIKSGIMGTFGTTNANAWSRKNSPGSASSFSAHADAGINGQNSAGLNMMWLPYFTISLTNTRINGHTDRDSTDWSTGTGLTEIYARTNVPYLRGKKVKSGASNAGRPVDTIARFYIDNIGTYRFNYKHQNATITAANAQPGKITLPSRHKFGTIRLSDKGIPALTANRASHNAQINVERDNYAFISLGFKSKVEAEASQRYLLFNGLLTETTTINNPSDTTNKLGMIYSDDSHPLGEYHTWYPFGAEDATWTNSFRTSDGSGRTRSPTTGGLPYMSNCIFGTSSTQRRTTMDNTTHGGDKGYWNFQALKDDDDYDARGVNRVEEFTQSGLCELKWNSNHYDEWDATIESKSATVCCGAIATTHQENYTAPSGSTLYDYHAFQVYDNDNDEMESNASFGTYEADKGPTKVSNWIGPNLNWLVYFKDNAGSVSKAGTGSGASDISAAATGYNNYKNSAAVIGSLSGHYIYFSDAVTNGNNNVHVPTGSDISLSPGLFVKRECPFVQARINTAVKISDNVWEVTVDSNKTLLLSDDEQYLVYHAGREWISTFEPQAAGKENLVHSSSRANDRNYYHDLHLTQDSPTARTQMVLEQTDVGNNRFKLTGHGLTDNQHVQFNTFNLTTGITAKTTYYVKTVDSNYFQVQAVSGSGTAVTLGGYDDYDIIMSFDNDTNANPSTYGNVGWGKEIDDMRRQNKYCATIVTAEKIGELTYRLTGQDTEAIIGGDTTYTMNTNSANVYQDDYQTDPASTLDELIWSTNDDMVDANGNSIGNRGYSDKPVPMGRFLNSTLCISPWRYWLTVKVPLHDYERVYSSIIDVYSTVDSDFSEAAGTAGCALQSTYHESAYTDSHKYTNYWNWNREPDSIIETNVDYGFGVLDLESGTGGHAGQKQLISGWNEIPFDGAAMAADLIENQDITLVGTATGDASVLMKFTSAEGTDTSKRPFCVSVFQDTRPAAPSDFMVQPDEDNPFYPRYSWSFEDNDIWYGFLIIDDNNIANQYHGSVLHIPLNWVGNTTDNGPKYYTNTTYKGKDANGNETQSGYMTEAGGVDMTVDGLQGFAVQFDGVDDYLTMANSNVWENAQPTTDMSLLFHIRPNNTPTSDEYIIYKEKEIEVWLDSNQQLHCRIYPDTGAALTATDVPIEVKSTSILPCDNEIPTNVILTLDAGLKSGNVKLYINGKLEDISGLRKAEVSKNNWPNGKNLETGGYALFLGCKYENGGSASNFYDGVLEELVIYNRLIHPVTPKDNHFRYDKPVSELTSAAEAVSKTYVARLYCKDYHNIRGVTQNEVSVTPQISFRKAAFRLRTVE